MIVAMTENLSRVSLAAHQRLNKHFYPPFIHPNDRLGPISQLIYEFVAYSARNEYADAAFRRLTAAHWSWSEVRDSPQRRIEMLIAETTAPAKKAELIIEALTTISDWSGWKSPSLEFLTDLSDDAARSWLERLRGVKPSMSAGVLLFSTMRRPVLPVDASAFRVASRLGLIPPSTDEKSAHAVLQAQLPAEWQAADVERHYFLIKGLSRRFCTARFPKCRRCPLHNLCAFGRSSVDKAPNRLE